VAGVDVATTCTYQASEESFMKSGYTRDVAHALMRRGVEVANGARTQVAKTNPRGLKIALSLGSYGAMLADGSEYTGKYGRPTEEELIGFHHRRINVYRDAVFDIALFETIPSLNELRAIDRLIRTEGIFDMPIWISCSFADSKTLCDGSEIDKVAKLLSHMKVDAAGMNCSHPRYAAEIVSCISTHLSPEKSVVCYPNRGDKWDPVCRAWVPESGYTKDQFFNVMKRCVDSGADVVGGTLTRHFDMIIRKRLL
jgi:homocysteine S-methyltransferase